QLGEDLVGLREAPLALLGEDQVAVYEHVELALLALLDPGSVLRPVVDLGRETRGPAVVAASDGAVEDADLRHGTMSLPERACRAGDSDLELAPLRSAHAERDEQHDGVREQRRAARAEHDR